MTDVLSASNSAISHGIEQASHTLLAEEDYNMEEQSDIDMVVTEDEQYDDEMLLDEDRFLQQDLKMDEADAESEIQSEHPMNEDLPEITVSDYPNLVKIDDVTEATAGTLDVNLGEAKDHEDTVYSEDLEDVKLSEVAESPTAEEQVSIADSTTAKHSPETPSITDAEIINEIPAQELTEGSNDKIAEKENVADKTIVPSNDVSALNEDSENSVIQDVTSQAIDETSTAINEAIAVVEEPKCPDENLNTFDDEAVHFQDDVTPVSPDDSEPFTSANNTEQIVSGGSVSDLDSKKPISENEPDAPAEGQDREISDRKIYDEHPDIMVDFPNSVVTLGINSKGMHMEYLIHPIGSFSKDEAEANELPTETLLTDYQVLNKCLDHLFQEVRSLLKENISEDDDIIFEIPALTMTTHEVLYYLQLRSILC